MQPWKHNLKLNQNGNAAMIFALCLLPLMAVIGSVLDINRQQTYQSKIQHALDFATISTARYALTNNASDTELKQFAQKFFNSELGQMSEASLSALSFNRNGDLVTLEVKGTMPTSIMQIVGKKTMPLGTTSAAVFGEPSAAEIALVLDTSFSMKGSRLTALEDAAKDMIDTLVKPNSDAVKMSIVPFATYVNVGTDKKGQSWIDVEADKSGTSQNCSIQNSWYKKNCKRVSYSCTRDGVKRTCKKWQCDKDDLAKAPRKCKTKKWTRKWYGCVKSRPDPYNIKDINYATKPVVGFVTSGSWACPTEIQELTNNPGQLKSTVAKLSANQNTYIATGLTWGLRTLSPGAPFDEAEPFAQFADRNGRKALVLMSDGANTKSPKSNGLHSGNSQTEADQITRKVCNEIKSNGIELYTIAFEISDAKTKSLLRSCATSPTNYYDAKSASDLKAAFEKIGTQFRDIALAY